MFFRQFYLQALGHASYLVGSDDTGEAFVFDPQRDVSGYLEVARFQGLRITHAADSHGHNDYLSGLTELRERSVGGLKSLPDPGHQLELGEVGIEVLHTPGHTPEHRSLLIYDRDVSADEPALLLSGGALLVGDIARPDLLGGKEQAEEAARAFCQTIAGTILPLPDSVQVFPTHVAGSLCGGNIGSRLSTTIGYERRTNAALMAAADEFTEQCLRLDNLPAVPPYWRRMRRQNLDGVVPLGVLREPPALSPDEFAKTDAVVLDTRSPEAFGGGHVPGALNAGLGAAFPTWAGTILPEGARTVLVLDSAADLWAATWDLLRIGYDPPVGWLAGGMMAWRTSGRDLDYLPQITVHELRRRLDDGRVDVLDVRQPDEWANGHIPGATFVTGAELPERLDEVPDNGRPVAVVCGSGYRSSASASLISRATGRDDLVNVIGGMAAWKRVDHSVSALRAEAPDGR